MLKRRSPVASPVETTPPPPAPGLIVPVRAAMQEAETARDLAKQRLQEARDRLAALEHPASEDADLDAWIAAESSRVSESAALNTIIGKLYAEREHAARIAEEARLRLLALQAERDGWQKTIVGLDYPLRLWAPYVARLRAMHEELRALAQELRPLDWQAGQRVHDAATPIGQLLMQVERFQQDMEHAEREMARFGE